MQLTKTQFDQLMSVKHIQLAMLDKPKQAQAIAQAVTTLRLMHKIDAVEGINNLRSALEGLEGHCKRVLREGNAPVPKYIPHPLFGQTFLEMDIEALFSGAPAAAPKPNVTEALESLKGLLDM